MIATRGAAVVWWIAAIACREPAATVANDGGVPAAAPRAPAAAPPLPAAPPPPGRGASDTAVAPPPCSEITHGAKIELLRRCMQDLGIGRWPNLTAWLLGAELPGEPTAPRPATDDALRARGAELYDLHCAICHGTSGDGKGPLAVMLADDPPRDFTKGAYKLRTTPYGSPPTDQDLFRTISRGLHGTAMIPWTSLAERDRWALVARLKVFSAEIADEPAPAAITIPAPPTETGALIARGQRLFQRVGCASCHGASGRGDGPGAALLRDAAGRQVRPTDLTSHRYRRGALTKEIYVTIRTGLDGTPMGSFDKILSSDDTWAVAAYVHSIAPRHVITASGVACPEIANVDGMEEEGVRMAMITMAPMGPRMQPRRATTASRTPAGRTPTITRSPMIRIGRRHRLQVSPRAMEDLGETVSHDARSSPRPDGSGPTR